MNTPHGRAAVNALFGNPAKNGKLDQAWYSANVVRAAPPKGMEMFLAWDKKQRVTGIAIHRLLKDNLESVLQEIWDTARRMVKQAHGFDRDTAYYDRMTNQFLANLGLNMFGGSFNFRMIRGSSTSASLHSYAIAIDLDPDHNTLGATKGRMPQWVIQIFERHGWFWGGKFKGRKDWMHFQFATGV